MADIANTLPLSRESVIKAHAIIQDRVHRTPVQTNKTLSGLASSVRDLQGTRWEGREPAKPKFKLWFKCENLQRIGAFKARGAFHAVKSLVKEPGFVEGGGMKKGVVTHSSGNHAQALALAAAEIGLPAHIVMPTISVPQKIAATKGYGANVIFSGSTSVEREAVAAQVIADTGARLVPPYDHPDIILGQGTMGLELQEQVLEQQKALAHQGQQGSSTEGKGLDAIITPCGGGGMLSGVALSCEGTGIRVFGSEPSFEGADDAKRGYESGQRVESVKSLTIADGLRTPLGAYPWSVIYERRLVAGMYSVTEDEIIATMRLVFERMKMVVEPSSCVPLAVVLFNEDFRAMVERESNGQVWDLGIIFSGGNVGSDALGKLFSMEEAKFTVLSS